MVLKNSRDEGLHSSQVHSGPAGQAIDPLDKLEPRSEMGSRNQDWFHLAEPQLDFVPTDRDTVVLLSVHSVERLGNSRF